MGHRRADFLRQIPAASFIEGAETFNPVRGRGPRPGESSRHEGTWHTEPDGRPEGRAGPGGEGPIRRPEGLRRAGWPLPPPFGKAGPRPPGGGPEGPALTGRRRSGDAPTGFPVHRAVRVAGG